MLSVTFLALGALVGVGTWILVLSLTDRAPLNMAQRVAPWVSDVSGEAHLVALDSRARRNLTSQTTLKRVASRVPRSWLEAFGDSRRLQILLAQSGRLNTLAGWRVSVVESVFVGTTLGLVGGMLGLIALHSSAWLLVASAVSGAGAAIFLKRYFLAREAQRRVAFMLDELPALCELLAICLTAGEGFREALVRVISHGNGPLVQEFGAAMGRVQTGIPAATALAEMAERLHIAPLSRMVDHVISSMERGSPLAEVLRVQAAEARAEAGRRLQERASAREVVMLLPLVFLILPITIAFAIFPGLLVIQTGL